MRLLISLLIFAFTKVQAQQVSFSWVKQLGGTYPSIGDNVYSIAYDNNENIIACGQIAGSGDLDPGPGVMPFTCFGSTDAFVVKLDANGNFLWGRQMGGVEHDRANSVATDAAGNVYITGQFTGTANFNIPGGGYFLNSIGGATGGFVTKLDANGNHHWTIQFGSDDIEVPNSIKSDPSGSVYCTGTFYGTADFDPGPGVFNLSASGGRLENYVMRLDPNGNFLWAATLGGNDVGFPTIAIDNSGNAYVAGSFDGTHDFNPGAAVNNLTSQGEDIFILKLTANGNFSWVKQMTGASSEKGFNIALDASGNIYCTGVFSSTVDFDPGPAISNLTSFGDYDIFICKLDNSGNFSWAKQMGGTGMDYGWAVATDMAGNVYTSGIFQGVGDFDPGICVYNLSAPDNIGDVFLTKLDASGNFQWVKQISGSAEDITYSVAVYPSGNIYMGGYFRQTADFDPAIPIHNLTALGNGDGFLHKMSPCAGNTSSTVSLTSCGPYTVNCNTYSVNGTYTLYLQNSVGCDSIVTLNLVIGPIPITNLTMSACDSFVWNGHTFKTTGIYRDTLLSTTGCDSIVQLQLTIYPVTRQIISETICEGQQYEGYTTSGTFIDTLTSITGCDSIRTINLSVLPKPVPELGIDKGICPGDTMLLSPGQFDTYIWQDGSSSNSLTVMRPGTYTVTVTNQCGTASDEIILVDGICDVYFPSAFTPNSDGKNDVFKMLGKADLSEFQLSVYDRWGQRVFYTKDPANGWDGLLKGQKQGTGIYVWHCLFKKVGSQTNTLLKGTVVLIH